MINKYFRRLASFYGERDQASQKIAHPIWELRSSENEEGWALARKSEEPAVDLREPQEKTACACALIGKRVASIMGGEVVPVVVLQIDDDMTSAKLDTDEVIPMPMDMIVDDVEECSGCSCPCHLDGHGEIPAVEGLEELVEDVESDIESGDDQTSDEENSPASRQAQSRDESDRDMAWSRSLLKQIVTPTDAINPILMGRNVELQPGERFEVVNTTPADAREDEVYDIPNPVVPHSQVGRDQWRLNDRIHLKPLDRPNSPPVFVTVDEFQNMEPLGEMEGREHGPVQETLDNNTAPASNTDISHLLSNPNEAYESIHEMPGESVWEMQTKGDPYWMKETDDLPDPPMSKSKQYLTSDEARTEMAPTPEQAHTVIDRPMPKAPRKPKPREYGNWGSGQGKV